MFRSLLFAALLSTLSSNAFAGTTDPMRTPSDVLADKFRADCSSAGGKLEVGKDAIVSTSSIRAKLSNDLLVDGQRVLCRGASAWSVASGIYTDDAKLIVSGPPAKSWVWGQDKPRFIYDATGAECGGARSCRIWKIWDGEKLIPEPIVYGTTTSAPGVRAPLLRYDGTYGNYDHNGSAVDIDAAAGRIIYKRPKPSIAGVVKPGQVMFVGTFHDDENETAEGVAFTFKKGCEPAPYNVRGERIDGWVYRLVGEAPVRAPDGCAVIGYTRDSPNAQLIFERKD